VNLVAPDDNGGGYPTLGPQVVKWMHEHLVFGPGDLRGRPLVLDAEQQAFIWRFYELFPKTHAKAGKRRFSRCALSLAKGLRKTELAACVAAAELHPDAPVRFNGWKGKGLAEGRGVTDPYVVLVAYTEEQSNELAYAALCTILAEGPLRDDFDIGLERIIPKQGGGGRAVSIAGSPNATDGARTTFQCFDETHRHTLPRQRQAHQTMLANLPKRVLSEAWSLEITTAPEPGTGSVAESTMDYAKAVIKGDVPDPSLFFFHRQAGDEHDLTTRDGRRAAVIEASGESASWWNIDAIVQQWDAPDSDLAYLERVWCNRLVQGAAQAFDVTSWRALAKPSTKVKDGATIVIGFDGSQFHDATGIVATDVASGFQWTAGVWECPLGHKEWQVPSDEVDRVIAALFDGYNVFRMYADPPYWESWVATWQSRYGKERVIEWWTNRRRQMAYALRGFKSAIREGQISHDDHPDLRRHIGNARREEIGGWRDEQGDPLWIIRKERPDSPHKIDLAMAAVLSWEARTDAIAAGALEAEPEFQMVFIGGGR
jgi:phage terminase large subunit-like protein